MRSKYFPLSLTHGVFMFVWLIGIEYGYGVRKPDTKKNGATSARLMMLDGCIRDVFY